ncbi:MAG: formate--tetrahydrofolate ligase [Bacilli bacterium]|nr:formate--tetrahydrofolate ligase [Bacilli bacterium]
MMTDLEIASSVEMHDIALVAKKLKIKKNDLELYGKYKAKLSTEVKPKKKSKLVLVTSINPTPLGEGKTTVAIGIHDSMRKLGINSLAVLREPSLGPVFGIKGGATGGGHAQVLPMDDINLHFNGDFHAITSCNNLLSSIIDNHIFHGNELNIDPERVIFTRCLDVNDRILRNVNLSNRQEHFSITAASEIMAIFCLANSLMDLKEKLGNILVAYTFDNKPVYARDLKCIDAMTILLKDAIKPNLVQTLYHNPVIIHGGPFANIAHGCNSIIATKLGLTLADYVITEAGFGADLGAEKFLDIKCRNNIKPNCIVVNFTIKALKYNGGVHKDEVNKPNMDALKSGFVNLERHIENMQKYTKNIVVCLNKFNTDTKEEIDYVYNKVEAMGAKIGICDSFSKGEDGSLELAKLIKDVCDNNKCDFKPLYKLNTPLENKIKKIIKEIYRAGKVTFTDNAKKEIENIKNNGFNDLPICIAKTQYSFSNDPKLLGAPEGFNIVIDRLKLQSGAGFVVVYLGDIMVMPGLSKVPNAVNMYIDEEKIEGIF